MARRTPTTEDLVRVLREQNPWHADGTIPTAPAPHGGRPPHRDAASAARPRSTRLRLNRAPPQPITPGTPEQQHSTGRPRDLWLKTFDDERWPLRLIATSSATAALRDRRTESGVGRWEDQYLPPHLLSEYLRLRGLDQPLPLAETLAGSLRAMVSTPPDLTGVRQAQRDLLLIGGFPELLIDAADRTGDERSMLLASQRTLRSDAVERAISKDLPQSFGIESPLRLERVLYVLSGQMTGTVSPTGIARDLGISQPTLDRHISYLEQAFLIFVLPNYSASETATQRRGRKIYCVDGAVRNAALQRGTAPLSDDVEMGALRENMAAAHLAALATHTQTRLSHWRSGSDEVDLVYDHPSDPLAFEIASSPDHRRELRTFADRFPRFRGRTYLVAPGATPVHASEDAPGALPYELFVWAVSAQADREVAERLASGLGDTAT